MPQGLISAAINKQDPLKSIVGYDAEKTAVDPTKETVQGQVAEITSRGGPLMQQAQTRALKSANRRGLINSSMSVKAGQTAVLDAALPIASQDAATYTRNKEANQAAGNQALQFTAGSQNQGALQQLTGNQNLEQIGAQGEQQRLNIGAQTAGESQLIRERGEIDIALQTADSANRERLLNRQAEIDRGLQELRGQQETSLQTQRGQQESELVNQRGAIERELQTADAATRERLLTQQAGIDRSLQELRGQQESGITAQRGIIERELQTSDAANRERLLGQQAGIDRSMQELRGQQETGLQTLRGLQETELQQMRGDQSKQLAEIENTNQKLLQSSQAATSMWNTTTAAISAILAHPDLPAQTKDALIARETEMLKSGLAMSSGISGSDFGGLLNFSSTGTGAGSSSLPPIKVEIPKNPKVGQTYTDEKGVTREWVKFAGSGSWFNTKTKKRDDPK